MNPEPQRCKGMRDMLPDDMRVFRHVERVFGDKCRQWGYREVKTPVLEYLHLFTAAGTLTPARLSQTYSFLDWDGWSGERVVLRPDSTIPAARLYVDNLARQGKARLYYVQNVFTFEPTGRENREKWQCGAEFIGGRTPVADAEMVLMAANVLQALGIRSVEVQISHAGLIRALLGGVEKDPAKQAELFDRILDGNLESLSQPNGNGSDVGKVINLILSYSGKAEGFLRNLKATALPLMPSLDKPLADFIAVAELLSPLDGSLSVSVASGRGFEYYTGTMVQFVSGGMRIGGGGRYDGLVSLIGGAPAPACGYALYMDRLINLVELPGREQGGEVAVVIAEGNPATAKAAFSLCREIRTAGYSAVLEVAGSATAGAPYVARVESGRGGEIVYFLEGRGSPARFGSAGELIRELGNRGKAGAA
ncbi:MAG: ATP phosphoribosyltransferase regulatory subunit [Chloroflexi bacterium]|nr:ATP phosphoribosyltransferase regulatory subunit [Chloroflexota bacterium]